MALQIEKTLANHIVTTRCYRSNGITIPYRIQDSGAGIALPSDIRNPYFHNKKGKINFPLFFIITLL
ncbi:hypothetical protein CW304_07850 [Bacillus sp. UFRGS-B20]|nr:hypothetical protein CW304_07850 [Bacillus sp. UFRGS-B20]